MSRAVGTTTCPAWGYLPRTSTDWTPPPSGFTEADLEVYYPEEEEEVRPLTCTCRVAGNHNLGVGVFTSTVDEKCSVHGRLQP